MSAGVEGERRINVQVRLYFVGVVFPFRCRRRRRRGLAAALAHHAAEEHVRDLAGVERGRDGDGGGDSLGRRRGHEEAAADRRRDVAVLVEDVAQRGHALGERLLAEERRGHGEAVPQLEERAQRSGRRVARVELLGDGAHERRVPRVHGKRHTASIQRAAPLAGEFIH